MNEKGQANIVGAGGMVIGLIILVTIAGMILLFTSALSTQSYKAIQPTLALTCLDSNVLDPTCEADSTIGLINADVNSAIESGFDSSNTVAGFMAVIFLALLASIVIAIFVGFLALGQIRGGGGVSF